MFRGWIVGLLIAWAAAAGDAAACTLQTDIHFRIGSVLVKVPRLQLRAALPEDALERDPSKKFGAVCDYPADRPAVVTFLGVSPLATVRAAALRSEKSFELMSANFHAGGTGRCGVPMTPGNVMIGRAAEDPSLVEAIGDDLASRRGRYRIFLPASRLAQLESSHHRIDCRRYADDPKAYMFCDLSVRLSEDACVFFDFVDRDVPVAKMRDFTSKAEDYLQRLLVPPVGGK
jgi:hypothetical protein